MPLHEERNVRIDGAITVWDGITRPEQQDDGALKYNLKFIVPPHSPDLQILDQLARQCLQESEFKGTLPQGAYWVMTQVQPGEFGGGFEGWWVVNGITYRAPQVFDENGMELQPMQYGNALYPGQQVNVLVSCKAYNNKSRGIKAQLEGFQIVASANAPRLAIGGGANAGSAFGAPAAGQPQQQPGFQQPAGQPQQQPGFQQPAGQPQQQPGFQQPDFGAPGGAPAASQPQQQPGFQQPASQPQQQPGFQQPDFGAPGGAPAASQPQQQPAQAHNFLPGGQQ